MHPYRHAAQVPTDDLDDEPARIARQGKIRRWLRWRGAFASVLALGAFVTLWLWTGVRALPEHRRPARVAVPRACKREVVCGSCQRVGDLRAATLLRCVDPPAPPPGRELSWCELRDAPVCTAVDPAHLWVP